MIPRLKVWYKYNENKERRFCDVINIDFERETLLIFDPETKDYIYTLFESCDLVYCIPHTQDQNQN